MFYSPSVGSSVSWSISGSISLNIDEATSGLKPAILENDVRVMVPLHIEKGMKIVVKTLDNSYVEKVK